MAKNRKSVTAELLLNNKILLYIILVLAIIVDGFIAYDLMFNAKVALQYIIIPIIMLLVDVVYFVSTFFTNYRFKYSLTGIVIYIGLIASGTIASLLLYAWNSSNIMMTSIAWISFLLVHIIAVAGVIYSIKIAKDSSKKKSTLPILSGSLVSTIVSILFISLVQKNGVYGQIYIEEAKVLTYQYDSGLNGYIVNGTAEGRGNTIVVPEQFNDKYVVGIDCQVFLDSSIKAVRFEKRHAEVHFVNYDALNVSNNSLSNVTLYAEKENLNSIRANLINESDLFVNEKINVLELASNFYPVNLDKDEVFISFEYDLEAYEASNGQILDVWYGKKGSTLSLEQLSYVDYMKYSDEGNESHLCWNYNENRKIVNPLLDSSGKKLIGQRINQDYKDVKVSFKDIYALSINNDNDDLYEIDSLYKTTNLDGQSYNYRYVTLDTANDLLENMPYRQGFSLRWKEGYNYVSDLSSYLKDLNNYQTFRLVPEWTLSSPVITKVETNNTDNSFIYGDDVTLSCDHYNIAPGIIYRYEWSHYNNLYEGKETTINNVLPSQSGYYKLTITAYSDTITSLESVNESQIYVSIDKKDLDFIWTLPNDLVYDGQVKDVTCTYDETQVINDDIIEFSNLSDELLNAGDYTVEVYLTGDCNNKYKIPTETDHIDLSIEKRPVTVTWNSTKEFVYDGYLHYVEVDAVSNYVNDDEQDIISSLMYYGKAEAGLHQTKIVSTHQNYYVVDESSSCDFEILKRDLEITYSPFIKEYDGEITPSSAYVYQVNNLAETDVLDDVLTLDYQGDATVNKDVGTYHFGAYYEDGELINNYNVTIVDSTIIITPREVELVWGNSSLTYNGLEQHSVVEKVTNSVDTEELDIIDTIIYSDGNIDVGNYSVGATLSSEHQVNYKIMNESDENIYSIAPKDLVITVQDCSKIYDGMAHIEFDYEVEGIAPTDLEEEIYFANFSGDGVVATDAGSYEVSVSLTEQLKYPNYNIEIVKGELTINPREISLVWDENNSFEYTGTEQQLKVLDVDNALDNDVNNIVTSMVYTNSGIHAGKHSQEVQLGSLYSNNYCINEDSKVNSYFITPKDLTITIGQTTKIYDGNPCSEFTHTVDGLSPYDNETDIYTLTYVGEGVTNKDVGSYIIDAILTTKVKYVNGVPVNRVNDYSITIDKGEAIIDPREIVLIWSKGSSFVYNGTPQSNKVIDIDNIVSSELNDTLNSLIYADGNIDVGLYVAQAELDNSNYVIIDGSDFCDYSISQRELIINIDPKTITYNGEIFEDYTYSLDGLATTDKAEEVFNITYGGAAASAIDVGQYLISASVTPGDKYSNYSISLNKSTLTIDPRQISATWPSQKTFEYDGTTRGIEIAGLNNVVPEDAESLLEELTYNEGNINAGTYTREVSLSNSNYVLSNTTCNYSITPRKIKITIDSKTKVYDGKVYTDFTHTTSNIASNDLEEEIFNVTYTGTAVSAKNVGTYQIGAVLTSKAKYSNYSVSITRGTLTITPREITLVWEANDDFEYTGGVLGPVVVDIENACDDVAGIISKITYNAGQVEVGNYTRIAYINNNNYVVNDGSDFTNYSITNDKLC